MNAPKPRYELDPAGVLEAVTRELEPEISRLQTITDGLQHTGPLYENFRAGPTPPPIVTTPIANAGLIFGDPDKFVDPGNFKLPFGGKDSDSAGEGYQRALTELSGLFESRFQTFLDNQHKFMKTMGEFRDRLLETVAEYESTEHKNAALFKGIMDKGEKK